MEKQLSRSEWSDFADAFSRSHDGWLISIYVQPKMAQRDCILRNVAFRGLTAELHAPHDAVIVSTTGGAHTAHIVPHPQRIAVKRLRDGSDESLCVTDDRGVETTVEFRSPMPVMAVDGMAV